jgi:large subunit ribosomal protein L10
MSKQIKQMEMDGLKATFRDVRDLVLLSAHKLDCQADNQLRAALRKKDIRLQVVKNSLMRRVFEELGIKATTCWDGPTMLAWGSSSLADLSKELDASIKKNSQLKAKCAIAEGQEVTFKVALAMPTRAGAIGRIVSLALGPASRLVSQILAPSALLAGQIKTLSERASGETEAADKPLTIPAPG